MKKHYSVWSITVQYVINTGKYATVLYSMSPVLFNFSPVLLVPHKCLAGDTTVSLMHSVFTQDSHSIYLSCLPDFMCYTFFFFFKSFWRTHVLFWGHWYPCYGFLVTSPLGFKARVGSALFTFFCGGEYNLHSPRSTTCQPLGSWCAASHFPCRSGPWLRFKLAITRTEDELTTIVPATRLFMCYTCLVLKLCTVTRIVDLLK